MSDISFHDLSSLGADQRASLLKRAETDLSVFVEKVRPIIEAVWTEGDAALLRFVRDLDKADVAAGGLKVSEAEFDAAFDKVDKDVVESIRFGIEN
ncbi:MAG: histidinol dehydrogenase, partial [Mesorhizobium sp.]